MSKSYLKIWDEDEEILESMNNLQSTIKRYRGGGLQIEIGGKWAMEVKPGIADHLPKETKSSCHLNC